MEERDRAGRPMGVTEKFERGRTGAGIAVLKRDRLIVEQIVEHSIRLFP
jgi:hypothetical protein